MNRRCPSCNMIGKPDNPDDERDGYGAPDWYNCTTQDCRVLDFLIGRGEG